jgi:peptide/nickel transport system permease protein
VTGDDSAFTEAPLSTGATVLVEHSVLVDDTGFEDESGAADESAGAARRRRARRILTDLVGGVIVLWGAATITFVAVHLMPGSPAVAYAGGVASHPSRSVLDAIIKEYGLNKPVVIQYLVYLGRLLHGNLGYSASQQMPVTRVLALNVGPTAELTLGSLVLSWVLALVWTVLTVRRGRLISAIGSGIEVLTASLPQYWLGIILLEIFAFHTGLFPATGGSGLQGLVLPSLTLAIPIAGFLGQITREEFESALEQPYVTSARARGMGDWGVRLRHALRHAILPGVTLSGWALGALISGAVIVESLFSRNGLGNTLLTGVTEQDMPLTIGVVLIVAVVYVVATILVDILYQVVDPRLRSAGQ